MRSKIVAGNWKMNKTLNEAVELGMALKAGKDQFPEGVKVVIAPPALYLANLELIQDSGFSVAAQNCSEHLSGAFTGEISAPMLQAMNIQYCIIGHSERRQYYHETDAVIAKKVDACLAHKVHPIFCCGEILTERNDGRHFEVVKSQVANALFHLTAEQLKSVIIAYEPVWAIGTGITASSAQAQEMHAFIRSVLFEKFGSDVAVNVSILYGGSVNAANSAELFACPDVDGGLVGGASLKAPDFISIISSARS